MHFLFNTASALETHICLPQMQSIPNRAREHKVAFITGATGFIGGYLFIELLNRNAFEKYYCLVRGEHERDRWRKLRKALSSKGFSLRGLEHRIVVVKGDFTKPDLGISEPEHDRISREADDIFHFAATMNWASPFNLEAELNIEALKMVIAMAALQKTKHLHYASSMGAWSVLHQPGKIIYEDILHDQPEGLPGGYCQLKWINERICHRARDKGIPVQIYRIGDVKGHSQTGHSDMNNFGNLLMLYLLKSRLVFSEEVRFNFLPVDYIAQAIAHLALNSQTTRGKTFQFKNPELVTLQEIAQTIATPEHPVKEVPLDKWIDSLDSKLLLDRSLSPVFKPILPQPGQAPTSIFKIGVELYKREHDTTNTDVALADASIHCPALLSDGILRTYLSSLLVV